MLSRTAFIISFILSIFVFCLIVLGASVRIADAGLSCPDWPLCFGQLVPFFNTQVFLEWFHRLIAGFISFLFLGLGFCIFKEPSLKKKLSSHYVIMGLILLSQIILGALTVLWVLKDKVVTAHLGFGYAFLAGSILCTLKLYQLIFQDSFLSLHPVQKTGARIFLIISLLLYFQVLFGGLVSSNYAGMACTDFPTCFDGAYFPTPFFTGAFYHNFHRLFGVALSILIMVSSFWMARKTKKLKLRIYFILLVVLVAIQILLGLTLVFYHLPTSIRVLHALLAVSLFTLNLMTYYEINYKSLH